MKQALRELIYPDSQPQSLWSILKQAFFNEKENISLVLEIPKYELLRLQTVVDDLIELCDNEIDYSLDELIFFVYYDIVYQARCGKLKYSSFSKRILELHKKYHEPIVEAVFTQVEENHWTRIEKAIPRDNRYIQYPIKLERKHIVRGNILVMDIMRHLKEEIDLGLNELLTLILIDFVSEVEKGLTMKRVKAMIESAYN